MGCAFCARPRSEQPRWLCAWGVHCPGGLYIFITSPVLAAQLPRVTMRALSQVRRVSSGELISGCDTPGRCQPSRIPGRCGQQLEACSQFGGRCHLWGRDCSSALPSSSGFTHPPLCLQRVRACTAASLISFGIRSILCSECTRGHCAALEPFLGQVFLFSGSLAVPQFGLLSCGLILAPSDCPQGIQAGFLPHW